jgi:hypothetical protein
MGCLVELLLLFGFFFFGCSTCDNKYKKEQTYRYTIEVDNGLFSDTYYSNYYEEKDGVLYFDVAGTKYTSNGKYTIKNNY